MTRTDTREGGSGEIDVMVNAEAFPEADAESLERAVRLALSSQGIVEAEISLTLLDDQGIRDLNRQYLARDCPTDVIAFTLGTGPSVLGDVYLGVEEARRQAADAGVTVAEELVRLAVHGTLHVLGHDHPEGPDREQSPMYTLQESLVRQLTGAVPGT